MPSEHLHARMKARTLSHLGRIALLALTVCCGATWILWSQAPERVEAFDAYLKDRYVASYVDRFQDVNKRLAQKDESALDELEELIVDLEPVKKGDRLESLKRSALQRAISVYSFTGNLERALHHADGVTVFDDRDIHNSVRRAALLAKMPGKLEEAEAVLEDLFLRFPATSFVSDMQISALTGQGRYAEAILAALRAESFGAMLVPTDAWEIYVDLGEGFRNDKKTTLRVREDVEPGRFVASLHMPKSVSELTRLRIDMPPSAKLIIDEWTITFTAGETVTTLPVLERIESSNQVVIEGDLVKTIGGGDSFVALLVPEELLEVPGVKLRMEMRITRADLQSIWRHAEDPDVLAEVRAALIEASRPHELERINARALEMQ